MPCPRRSEATHAGPTEAGDRGSVTVEAAVAIGTLVLVAAAAIGAVATVMASVRCVDAARELARLAARGDTDRGRSAASGIAPDGARMEVHTDGDTVTVVVSVAPVGLLPMEVSGTAAAVVEPGAVPTARSGTGIPDDLDVSTDSGARQRTGPEGLPTTGPAAGTGVPP